MIEWNLLTAQLQWSTVINNPIPQKYQDTMFRSFSDVYFEFMYTHSEIS